jgi:hypothetical protein
MIRLDHHQSLQGHRRNHCGSVTIRPDFQIASQPPYSLPHISQTDARSLADTAHPTP